MIRSNAFMGSIALLAGIVALLAWTAVQCGAWARSATERVQTGRERALEAERRAASAEEKLRVQERSMPPVRGFLGSWYPHVQQQHQPERELAVVLRTSLEAAAQRKLGLVTDHVVTPETSALGNQGGPVPVQRVTLRASGESLVALLTWLGEAEMRFPLARVEHWEFTGTGGKNTALKLTLAQPLPGAWCVAVGASSERKNP